MPKSTKESNVSPADVYSGFEAAGPSVTVAVAYQNGDFTFKANDVFTAGETLLTLAPGQFLGVSTTGLMYTEAER